MKNKKWGVWCIRYSTSVMGPDEKWMKTGGRWDEKNKTWDDSEERRWEDSEKSARILAARLQEDRRSFNVAYEAREVSP